MTTVLLVEDEADVRELIEDAFAEHELDVVSAVTDEHAYEFLAEDAQRFAVLVADINLGAGTTGFDVARRARRLNRDLKVIYITGHAAHMGRFGVEGALMFPKPFNPHELALRVQELLRDGGPGD
jgi:two-component system, cell cycle response regulator CpdR